MKSPSPSRRKSWPAWRLASRWALQPARWGHLCRSMGRALREGGARLLWHRLRLALRRAAQAGSYAEWIAHFDARTDADFTAVRARIENLVSPVKISVVMPVFDAPAPFLTRALESVAAQIYPEWELCIADDASTAPHVAPLLNAFAERHAGRVKLVFRETNGHISAASNSALALATGEFVALLDHDDELSPLALARVAEELAAHPEADILYSDEDKIDAHGRRFEPYFKPAFNPELLRGQNFVSHLGVYRRSLLGEIGGFREGFEGSQDYDLVLRASERTTFDRIRHIPAVLYHWRAIRGSLGLDDRQKLYAHDAARRALREHLDRVGDSGATVMAAGGGTSFHRVAYPVPEPLPRVCAIVPTRDRLELLRVCVDGLLHRTDYGPLDLLILDNRSERCETRQYLAELPARDSRVRVLPMDAEFNFSAMMNLASARTAAPVLALLNNDLQVVRGDWLREMVAHASRPEIGCVGAKLVYPNRLVQHAGIVLGVGENRVAAHAHRLLPSGAAGYFGRALLAQNVSAVTAACLVCRREVFELAGGFDERLAVSFNDVDFCLRVWEAGFRVVWTPFAELVHHESATRRPDDAPAEVARSAAEMAYFRARWGHWIDDDPAFSPNLSCAVPDFSISPAQGIAAAAGPVARPGWFLRTRGQPLLKWR